MDRQALWALHESLRRYTRFHSDKPLTDPSAWTGLGFKSDYRAAINAGLMQFIHPYRPRCMGWLKLTDKGAAIVQVWLDQGYTFEDIEGSARGLPSLPEGVGNA